MNATLLLTFTFLAPLPSAPRRLHPFTGTHAAAIEWGGAKRAVV